MATMLELQDQYEVLARTHRQLLNERNQLLRESANGAAFADHGYRTRAYMSALETYVVALGARRHELEQHKKRSLS